ncbi:zinc-binding oxidoreductase CipB, variant [Salpingoeca rosetta]|uniref:Zinc-binding oxidoreductase CipB, variant n=1 Tax=Salpingoeca rosetta (strain ATCC 50818 / BSB-021) TaxID=946362 RepID=F2UB30_SALR5|nr:zinc-binding oxidoreductase CipB, variant [Salpingoeca rosetta]EGD74042.1 zinc-binding oxidoreductase CipB, variant [Salpingoeca rosetta]|eukprot:XP_004993604.1 zinc-binding oxidoreductase CipB, variant [Salpingoeca rosetta]
MVTLPLKAPVCLQASKETRKMADQGFLTHEYPIVLGCDVAGEVIGVGQDVKRFKVGDKIAAFTPLGTRDCGGFAQYCKCPEELVLHVPEGMPFDKACTLPVGMLTAGLGLFHSMKLPLPSKASGLEDKWLLVWGASSVVGLFCVQLAKACGLKVVATASKRNFELVKTYGADAVFDYHSASVIDDIKAACNDTLTLAFDAVGKVDEAASALNTTQPCMVSSCAGALSKETKNVTFETTMLGDIYLPHSAEKYAALAKDIQEYEKLISTGVVKPPHLTVLNGLDKVVEGLDMLANHKVSGQKLVVSLA